MFKRIILILVIVALVVSGGVLWLRAKKQKASRADTNSLAQKITSVPPTSESAKTIPPLKVQEAPLTEPSAQSPEEMFITQTVKTFTEFYGTYAVSGNGVQWNDVAALTTVAFRATLQGERAAFQKLPTQQVITTALVTKIISRDSNSAVVEATTQRTQTVQGTVPKIFRQKITLALVSQGSTWLIDSAKWHSQTF